MAAFEWLDCMPNSDDKLEVYLAKFKRLQQVYQVSDQRLSTRTLPTFQCEPLTRRRSHRDCSDTFKPQVTTRLLVLVTMYNSWSPQLSLFLLHKPLPYLLLLLLLLVMPEWLAIPTTAQLQMASVHCSIRQNRITWTVRRLIIQSCQLPVPT